MLIAIFMRLSWLTFVEAEHIDLMRRSMVDATQYGACAVWDVNYHNPSYIRHRSQIIILKSWHSGTGAKYYLLKVWAVHRVPIPKNTDSTTYGATSSLFGKNMGIIVYADVHKHMAPTPETAEIIVNWGMHNMHSSIFISDEDLAWEKSAYTSQKLANAIR